MKKICIITLLFFLTSFRIVECFAQQLSSLNQSLDNVFLINPANAGCQPYTQAYMHVRDQWSKMSGAPLFFVLSIDGKLKHEKSGIGFQLISDKQPIISNVSGMFTYSYTAKFGANHSLSMALSTGLLHNSIRVSDIDAASPTENTLSETNLYKLGFDVGAGIVYHFKKLDVGIAGFHLINTSYDYLNKATNNGLIYHLVRNFDAHAAYTFALGNNLDITPMAIIYSTQGMPVYTTAACKVTLKDDYWLATGYRTDRSLAFSCGFLLSDCLNIGYSFEFPINKYAAQLGQTHEVTIGIRFFGRRGASTKRNNVNQKDLEQIMTIIQTQSQQIDELKNVSAKQKEEIETQLQRFDSQQEEIAQLLKQQSNASDTVDIVTIAPSQIDSIFSASDSISEIERFLVVLGAYDSLNDAKLFQKILEREIGLITWIYERHQPSLRRYLVYSRIVTSNSEALAEYDRLYDLKIERFKQGNLWIYQIKSAK